MSTNLFGTINGQTVNITSSYSVIYKSATTYKVNVTWTMGPPFIAWVRTDGTLVAVYFMGQNMTGSQAASIFSGAMGPFAYQISFVNQLNIYTSTLYFHATSQGTATFGPTTMSVTNYAANSLPETFSACGTTFSLTEFSLQVGNVPSGSLQLVTYVHENGTLQSSSGSQSVEVTMRLISVTLA